MIEGKNSIKEDPVSALEAEKIRRMQIEDDLISKTKENL